ncbi:uncharacterized protein LOC125524389 [Triticum urartu]|uniref:uncharacterized protein LOC125519102 n=1 Tax=Triticum urartu TaxID=4572 RepID=UPI0020448413|nr:uncharacterized protein LOC125519102 [Triticum urartu]XP_048545403.1 uncharacterized protein LOC125524389 [Triticum urartu]
MDFDNSEMKFFKCSYKVGPIKFNRFIKRGVTSSKDWASDYHFVRALAHPAAIQVENYVNSECVIISEVDGSFSKWLNKRKPIELFADGTMLPILRNMTIQLASLVKSILAKEVSPRYRCKGRILNERAIRQAAS